MDVKPDMYNHQETSRSLQTFWMVSTCVEDCIYQVSSPYKMFNLLAVANMSEKTPLDLWGGCYTPLWDATETTFHLSKKWNVLTRDAWVKFDNTCKKSLTHFKEQSHK